MQERTFLEHLASVGVGDRGLRTILTWFAAFTHQSIAVVIDFGTPAERESVP